MSDNPDVLAAPGPRERRKLAMRRSIELAALRLAVERGLEGVTVQAISDAADIAPRTFFGYFGSKEEALALDRLWTAARLCETLAARSAEEPPLRSLRAVAHAMAADVTSDPERMRLWREVMGRHPDSVHWLLGTAEERVGALVEIVAQRTGADPQRDPYPALAVWVAWVAGQLAVERWLRAGEASVGESSPASFVDEAFDLLERGL